MAVRNATRTSARGSGSRTVETQLTGTRAIVMGPETLIMTRLAAETVRLLDATLVAVVTGTILGRATLEGAKSTGMDGLIATRKEETAAIEKEIETALIVAAGRSGHERRRRTTTVAVVEVGETETVTTEVVADIEGDATT